MPSETVSHTRYAITQYWTGFLQKEVIFFHNFQVQKNGKVVKLFQNKTEQKRKEKKPTEQ